MLDRFPGYDVLSKRDTPSWNEQTRRVLDKRLALDPNQHRFLSQTEWETLCAFCNRIAPQPPERAPIPVAALVDQKLDEDVGDGYRNAKLPKLREAWRTGLAAIDAEARSAHARRFHELSATQQDELIAAMKKGDLNDGAWRGMPPHLFLMNRAIPDIVKAYYAHPTAWNEIGWGGPASPRGYVRMHADRRDPWEAAEAKPGHEAEAYRENLRVGH